jgi:uncharacterized coiled-coil DUF342 family protein
MSEVDWKFWVWLGHMVVTAVIAVTVWLRKPGQDAASSVRRLRDNMNETVQKVRDELSRQTRELREIMSNEIADINSVQDRLEERVQHMPKREEVTEVRGDVKALVRQVEGLISTQNTQTMALSRIETYLLNKGRNT